MTKTIVSVVTPVYNAGNFITKTLDCLKKQTFREFEGIIINDGSTDNTQLAVSEYIRLNPELALRLIKQENKGIAGARNRGILEAKGIYIAFLDHDDIWYPEKLKRCYEVFRQEPQIDLVCHNELMRGSAGRVVSLLHYGPYTSDMFRRLLFKRNYLSTSATMVKRDAILEAGLFREEPCFSTVEDYDLWIRLSKKYKFYFIPDTLGEYIINDMNASLNLERHYNNQIEMIRLNFKDYREKRTFDPWLIKFRIARIYLIIARHFAGFKNIKDIKIALRYIFRGFLQVFAYERK